MGFSSESVERALQLVKCEEHTFHIDRFVIHNDSPLLYLWGTHEIYRLPISFFRRWTPGVRISYINCRSVNQDDPVMSVCNYLHEGLSTYWGMVAVLQVFLAANTS